MQNIRFAVAVPKMMTCIDDRQFRFDDLFLTKRESFRSGDKLLVNERQ
jgi:hypothetical protein